MLLLLTISIAFADDFTPTKNGFYAYLQTNTGNIICELYFDQTPRTVANFMNLAEGRQPYLDIKTGKPATGNYYDGQIFHRVIPNFMIQGGDPTGTGRGGPGYRFGDEFRKELTFDRPGRLAMANSGPNTNGSQFFITHGPTPWLNYRHTIFGQVVSGQDVVDRMGNAPRDSRDKPLTDIVLESVQIVRID